jgi:hypothetical protein
VGKKRCRAKWNGEHRHQTYILGMGHCIRMRW